MSTQNCRARREPNWHGIIIHHTGIDESVRKDESKWAAAFTNTAKYISTNNEETSAHYLIGLGGEMAEICDPQFFEAFHAGVSSAWNPVLRKKVTDWNRWAIGIELLGDGSKYEYTDAQYDSLIDLCWDLKEKFKTIHIRAVYGHEEIAPERKVDPGVKFNWFKLLNSLNASF